MASVVRWTRRRKSPPAMITAGNGEPHKAVRRYQGPPAADRLRSDPVAVGLWLGAIALGAGGAVLGACMGYRHPVAVVISALWWGIYFGCFGASIGALSGLWTGRAPARPSRGSEGPEDPRAGPTA
jgi:hypothetical protein